MIYILDEGFQAAWYHISTAAAADNALLTLGTFQMAEDLTTPVHVRQSPSRWGAFCALDGPVFCRSAFASWLTPVFSPFLPHGRIFLRPSFSVSFSSSFFSSFLVGWIHLF